MLLDTPVGTWGVLKKGQVHSQQQYSQTMIYSSDGVLGSGLDREERLVQWGAANNVKIKPGSSLSPSASDLEGTCQLPQCWSLGRRVMLMADQTADPCHSFYNLACGGWLANISHHSGPGARQSSGLENFSVMDERKADIDRKIKSNI